MIITEYYKKRKDGVVLVKTYSDSNKYIQQVQTGFEDTVMIDVGELDLFTGKYFPKNYTYIETDKEIEEEVVEE